jgi:hypothetical protein
MQMTIQTEQQTELQFNSPSRGRVDFTNVIYDLVNFIVSGTLTQAMLNERGHKETIPFNYRHRFAR